MVNMNTGGQKRGDAPAIGGEAAALPAQPLPAPAPRPEGRSAERDGARAGADASATDWVVMGGLIALVAIVAVVMLTVVIVGGSMD